MTTSTADLAAGASRSADPAAAARDERLRRVSLIARLMRRPELGALAGLVLVTVFFGLTANPAMFTLAGVMTVLSPAAQLGILAIAAALLMIGGEFDLSIGSMIAFAGLVFGALIVVGDMPLLAAIVATFVFAGLMGAVNGQIVIRTRLPSFIVTLAFLFILRGLSLVGLKWATGGSTQLRGIGDKAGDGIVRELFSGQALEGLFAWLAQANLIAKFPNGTPTVTGVPVGGPLVPRHRRARDLCPLAHPLRQLDLRRRRRRQRRPQRPACRSTGSRSALFMADRLAAATAGTPSCQVLECRLGRGRPRRPEGVRGDHRGGHRRLPAHRRLRLGDRRLPRRAHLRHGRADRHDLFTGVPQRLVPVSSSAPCCSLAVLFNNVIRRRVTGER
jgi:hypothetical protein